MTQWYTERVVLYATLFIIIRNEQQGWRGARMEIHIHKGFASLHINIYKIQNMNPALLILRHKGGLNEKHLEIGSRVVSPLK